MLPIRLGSRYSCPSALTQLEDSQRHQNVWCWPWHWGRGHGAAVCVIVSAAERVELAAIAADRNRPRQHIQRAQIVLVVLDNYATHKHPKVLAWMGRHPRWPFHFPPTSTSWLNAVGDFFSKMTRQRISRGVFRSIADLQAAIKAYLAEYNAGRKPFVWTKPTDVILAKLDRCYYPFEL